MERNPNTARRNAEMMLCQLDRAFQNLAKMVHGELTVYQDQTPLRAIRKTVASTRRKLTVQAASPEELTGGPSFLIRLDVRKSVEEGWYSWARLTRLHMPTGHERQLVTLIQYWAQLENVSQESFQFHPRAETTGGLIRVPTSSVHITGWNTGFKKNQLISLIQEYFPDIEPQDPVRMVNDLLAGIPFRLQTSLSDKAEMLKKDISDVHGICFVVHDKNELPSLPPAEPASK